MTQATIDVFCDESGYTGTKLLDLEQRIFAFAAVAVSNEEAWRIIHAARQRRGVLGSELKAAVLLKTEPGRELIRDCLEAISGRYRYVIFDKLLGLTTKLFEYIYEPVFQDDPKLLYDKDLHRFVGMYCYMFFTSGDPVAERAMVEFQAFMRAFDPVAAPSLFDPAERLEADNPFEIVRRFAQPIFVLAAIGTIDASSLEAELTRLVRHHGLKDGGSNRPASRISLNSRRIWRAI